MMIPFSPTKVKIIVALASVVGAAIVAAEILLLMMTRSFARFFDGLIAASGNAQTEATRTISEDATPFLKTRLRF